MEEEQSEDKKIDWRWRWTDGDDEAVQRRSKDHLHPETLRPHHWHATTFATTHQSPLAPSVRANYIQGDDADIPCTATAWLCTIILGDVIYMCRRAPHRRRLKSASTEPLDVPTCRRSTVGGRAFSVAGSKVWNGLPSDVTSTSSLAVFKNRLKTHLFRRWYETVWLRMTFLIS